MQGESEAVMHFTAMQLHAALHGSKENQQGIVVPMIARRRKMQPVCQPALTALKPTSKFPLASMGAGKSLGIWDFCLIREKCGFLEGGAGGGCSFFTGIFSGIQCPVRAGCSQVGITP